MSKQAVGTLATAFAATFFSPPRLQTPETLSDDVRAELERMGESPEAVLAWLASPMPDMRRKGTDRVREAERRLQRPAPALAEVLEAIEQDPARMARAAAMLAEGREGIEQPIPVRSMLRSLERAALARYERTPPRGQSEGTGWRRGWYLTERGRVVASFVESMLARGERRTEPPEAGPQLVVQGPPRGDR